MITHGFGVVCRSAKGLGPVGRQALSVLRVMAVGERVADNRICQAARVPDFGQIYEGLLTTSGFVDCLNRRLLLKVPQ